MMVLDHSVAPAVVLVVEDEMLLRMSAHDMVEDAGFTSVEAVGADEAVAILESRFVLDISYAVRSAIRNRSATRILNAMCLAMNGITGSDHR
jgi:CheY-like chemotaxis protein